MIATSVHGFCEITKARLADGPAFQTHIGDRIRPPIFVIGTRPPIFVMNYLPVHGMRQLP